MEAFFFARQSGQSHPVVRNRSHSAQGEEALNRKALPPFITLPPPTHTRKLSFLEKKLTLLCNRLIMVVTDRSVSIVMENINV